MKPPRQWISWTYNAEHAFEEVQNNKTHIKTNINSYENPNPINFMDLYY